MLDEFESKWLEAEKPGLTSGLVMLSDPLVLNRLFKTGAEKAVWNESWSPLLPLFSSTSFGLLLSLSSSSSSLSVS